MPIMNIYKCESCESLFIINASLAENWQTVTCPYCKNGMNKIGGDA